MKIINVTQLEKQVLEALASEMYAELGFSDVGLQEVCEIAGIHPRIARGVASSLIKKGLLYIDTREGVWGINHNDANEHIWHLEGDAMGLVPAWVEEAPDKVEPVRLVTRDALDLS